MKGWNFAAGFMLAPAVVMMRLPLLAAEAGRAAQLAPETARAVAEKSAALAEGAVAAQLSLMRSAAEFWPNMLLGRSVASQGAAALERAAQAALKPASRQVRSNHRRLSRRKRSA
jgi:hypothetical protein